GAQGTVSRPPVASPDSYAQTMAPGYAPTMAPVGSPTGGPHISGAQTGGALTTNSGSAAQMVAMTEHKKSGKGVAIGVGALVLVLGGIGVGVALNSGDDKPAQVASAPDPARVEYVRTPDPVKPEAGKPEAGKPEAGKPEKPAIEAKGAPQVPPPHREPEKPQGPPCPEGMAKTVDTNGHCCWPGQAWSSAKNRCIGAPTCPPSMKARGEQCIAQQIATASHATFKLDASTYAPDAPITIKFPGAMSSKANNRAWITIVEAGKPPAAYGGWEFVADGATTAKLAAPKQPGGYELRLHTEYPAKSTNLVHKVAFSVDAAAPQPQLPATKWRFHVKDKTVQAGEAVELKFAQAMEAAPGEKFWVTIVKPDADAASYSKYEYVPPGAHKMLFAVPNEPGDYELRLHANYPTKATNLVHRVKIRVGD
ncbi:MAG TPA: hypothetical protein VIV11_28895, partial [Kofleriaceae bacterium]